MVRMTEDGDKAERIWEWPNRVYSEQLLPRLRKHFAGQERVGRDHLRDWEYYTGLKSIASVVARWSLHVVGLSGLVNDGRYGKKHHVAPALVHSFVLLVQENMLPTERRAFQPLETHYLGGKRSDRAI